MKYAGLRYTVCVYLDSNIFLPLKMCSKPDVVVSNETMFWCSTHQRIQQLTKQSGDLLRGPRVQPRQQH